jgi:hemerythrin-like domain-containing protein
METMTEIGKIARIIKKHIKINDNSLLPFIQGIPKAERDILRHIDDILNEEIDHCKFSRVVLPSRDLEIMGACLRFLEEFRDKIHSKGEKK